MARVQIPNTTARISVPNRIPCEHVIRSGPLAYRVNLDWFQVPEHLRGKAFHASACDKNDYIYCGMRNPDYPILVFAPDGSFDHYLGQGLDMRGVHGISVNSDGNIWCADIFQHVVRLLDKDTGEVLMTLGELGKPSDTGYDPDYSGSAGYLTIKRMGGPFNRPTRLIEGMDGRLYAADGYGNCAVHRFSHSGVYEKSWGGPGREPGHFGFVHGIWQDKLGRLWTTDRDQDRIQVFDTDGNLLYCMEGILTPGEVWSDEEYIYVSECDKRISVFDMDYHMVAQIGYLASHYAGHDITGDSKGNLYVGYTGDLRRYIRLEKQ